MFRLMRYFVLTALVSLSVAAVILAALFSQAAEDDLLTSAERANQVDAQIFANALTARLGDSGWQYLTDVAPTLAAESLRSHPMTERMHEVLRALATGTSVAKVKIFSPKGVTLYSSEAAQIGEDRHNTPLVQRAIAGEIVSTLSHKEAFQSFDGRIEHRDLVSTYIPYTPEGAKKPVAIFELYADLTTLRAAQLTAHWRQLAIVATVMLGLFAAQVLIVRHGARTIARQHASLEAAKVDLENARKRAEAANAAKSSFLANMSHEIRTPLHGMLGMVELLSRTELNAAQQQQVETLGRSSSALLRLLDGVLDLSKIEAGHLEVESQPFMLGTLVREACALMEAPARLKGLTLRLDVPAEAECQVLGDSLRLQQVLHNLIGNALKFTASGGITVTLRRDAVDGGVSLWRFAVADTGIGMAPEVAQRLFKPFVQADASTSRRFGGTGLGLAISRQLVELMGGRIGVDAQPGHGSVFTFNVKLIDAPMAAASKAAVEPSPDRTAAAGTPAQVTPSVDRDQPDPGAMPTLAGVRVLLAEDNPVNVLYAEAALAALGCEVQVAADGAQAVERALSRRHTIVLMDCQMPGEDGFAATRRIRSAEATLGRSRVPIVALTAGCTPQDLDACLAAGMDDLLGKPFDMAELETVLHRWSMAEPAPAG